MNKENATQFLKAIHQLHLLEQFDSLTVPEKKILLNQVASLDPDTLKLQQQLLKQPPKINVGTLSSFTDFDTIGSSQNKKRGHQLIKEGKVGALLIAGGQGTRLRFDGPKGIYPITSIKKKSLFQLFSEKVVAASHQANRPLPLTIMTSPDNDSITRDFFSKNNHFGLNKEQLFFFTQGSLPLLDRDGNLFLETAFQISHGADGNGSCLKHFVESGLWKKWWENGIEYLNTILIDNPLADPYDAELIGTLYNKDNDIVIKCTERRNPDEKVGVLINKNNQPHVIEYTELPREEQQADNPDGSLRHRCANLSLFAFTMSFIEKAASQQLPYHLAHKAVKALTTKGALQSNKPNGYKFEQFIFDLLPLTTKVSALLYPREQCFAPLKNEMGLDSPETVRAALQLRDRQIIEETTGLSPPNHPFELSQEFYYPTENFLDSWKGRDIDQASFLFSNPIFLQ